MMKNKILNHFQGNYESFYGKHLQGVKKIGGDEYKAICPFHEDTNPSFNFNNQNGKYFCHGCGKKGDSLHFYAKIHSLDTRRDFNKILKGIANDFKIPWEEKKSRISKTYDYTDINGKLLFQVVRMYPKDFRQRRPGVNGNWIWNLKNVQRVLYHLPEVLNASEVIIIEGEKDTETVRGLGFICTTCPMGANKWREEYNEALKGKDIVLIPDNDPEGREHMAQVAISLNGTAKSLKLIDLPGLPDKGDVSDWVAKFDPIEEAAERLAVMIDRASLYEPDNEDREDQETGEESQGKHDQDNKKQVPMSIILVEIIKNFDLFHTNGDEIYAQYRANGHRELWNIRNKKFKNHISNIAYDAEGRMPSENAIRDALNVIEGIARFDRDIKIETHTRIARVKDTIYIDLVNKQWEVIEISEAGWKVVKGSPVYFERTKGMLPLPYPTQGGDIRDLRELLNLPNDNDATWILIVSWVLQAMNDIGSYPILIVNGEQGSAKSTLSKLVRSIIDPNQADLRSLPRNEHDIVIAAKNGWVLGFDNLSGMQNWLSDALCRISTGAGFATRKLYSDNEEEIFYSRKPIILNGINSLVRRNDLADRALLISLPPIEGEGNIKESVLQKHFADNLPSILGGFYTAVAEGLKNKDLEFGNLPRMADFADWIQKAEPALPWAKGRFIEAYEANRASIIDESINQDLVGSAIKAWVDSWIMQTEWEGSASELQGILEQDMNENTIRSKGWPRATNSLSRRINSQTKFLRQCGIEIEPGRKGNDRTLIIRKNLQYFEGDQNGVRK